MVQHSSASVEIWTEYSKPWKIIKQPRMRAILKIAETASDATRRYLKSEGFIELLPPIIGPVTDPGIRGARQVSFDYYGRMYKVMSSAILYKQLAVSGLGRIFFFSPNIRLEPPETISTKRHLAEFIQIDLEVAEIDYFEAMKIAEHLFSYTVDEVMDRCVAELELLGRRLRHYKPPFKKYSYDEILKILWKHGRRTKYGMEISWEDEEFLSAIHEEPFFIYDYPKSARGFYDREDESRPGILRDFDMIYPSGYGEAISGGEREYKYERVVSRMLNSGENPNNYEWYLEMLKDGVPPSAGFGIGIERLTRFLCGLETVWEARLCPKIPGIHTP
ncbi:MAG: asparagine synthetase A [Nitrososphaerota archaeon]